MEFIDSTTKPLQFFVPEDFRGATEGVRMDIKIGQG